MKKQDFNDEQSQGSKEPNEVSVAMQELGKHYFRNLLAEEHPNLKIGDELKFGIRFYGSNGEPISEIIETIHKESL